MENFPLGIFQTIIGTDVTVYRALLGVSTFARLLNPSNRTDFMVLFGYGVDITDYGIFWWLHDEFHRTNGPAIITEDGEQWWFEGKKHRINGPAIVTYCKQEWWINCKRHREDGPAIDYPCRKEW